MQGKRTRNPCVYRTDEGRTFVQVTVYVAGKKVFRRQMLHEGATESDALRVVANMKDVLADQASPRPRALTIDGAAFQGMPTLGEYVTQWLRAKSKRLRRGVAHEVAHRLGTHVLPVEVDKVQLGKMPLDRINRMVVEAWVAWAERAQQKKGKPYSADTVAGWWRIFTQVLRDGTADFELPDPTRRVTPPRLQHVPRVRTTETLSPDKVDELVEKAATHCPERAAEVTFLALTGCRAGEAFGLHWQHVDLEVGTAVLAHSATRGELEHTKTGSPRTIPLHPRLVAVLREHQKAQVEGRVPKPRSGLVFPAETGEVRLEQSLAKPFKVLTVAIGQKVTPQVLRRTMNTNLLGAGVDPITIQSIMGHTSMAMTARYAGISVEGKANALAKLLGPRIRETSSQPARS
jgi:integrase